MRTPPDRIRSLNAAPVKHDGAFVLYWMSAFRRTRFNHALQHAVEWAAELSLPLIVLEPLRLDYQWASVRHHRFIMDGMLSNSRSFARTRALYYPYLEPRPGSARGLLASLGADAAVVVGDDWPGFFNPRVLAVAARSLTCRFIAVDASGLAPVYAAPGPFRTAQSMRRHLQSLIPDALASAPLPDPAAALSIAPPALEALIPDTVRRWPPAQLADPVRALQHLTPLDHTVAPVTLQGGEEEGRTRLQRFVVERLAEYADQRNDPNRSAASGLSPFLHYGHISTFEVVQQIGEWEGWTPLRLAPKPTGRREGWWGMSRGAEAFLDELVTWREVGLNAAAHLDNYTAYTSLPEWAQATLEEHAADEREWVYPLQTLEEGATHDTIWNAAQRQLRREGTIHNYMRMLWGKKILEWSATPQDALHTMVHLNNKYALDGRDPNSYSGIFWCLGRYDRPWGPVRPVFGTIRYMSSANTARKFDLSGYLSRYGEG